MSDQQEQEQDGGRTECTPCRGTGTVVSALGGQQREIPCPWCGGSGRFERGRDAQQAAPAVAGGPSACAPGGD